MIFLSAQPVETYFIWQLEIQIANFISHGIQPENIHVLLGYTEKLLPARVKHFLATYGDKAMLYTYQDTRCSRIYLSSIRPNIIKQHFQALPWLENEMIFYHDSDIIFTKSMPDFERLSKGSNWYFSDTKSYIDSKYLLERGGDKAFQEICTLMDIDPNIVRENDANAGGAQYFFKNITAAFWGFVESDSEKLYRYLEDNKSRYANIYADNTGNGLETYVPISAWCADMWSVLWNSYKIAQVKIDQTLDFSWPHYDIIAWEKMNIFHNSGVDFNQKDKLFFKSQFHHRDPYFIDFSHLDNNKCSFNYAKIIEEYTVSTVFEALDTTVIIPLRIDSESRVQNLSSVIRFLKKYFLINIMLLESDISEKVPNLLPKELLEKCEYFFIEDKREIFHRQELNNRLANLCHTQIIVKYDSDIILSPQQLFRSILEVRFKNHTISYPYDGRFIDISGALRKIFLESIDIKELSKYINSNYSSFVPSYGGCCVLDRIFYIENGMDNTIFNGWGFEDQELAKRYKILGQKIQRQEGPVYHLNHDRGQHSYFIDDTEMIRSYAEYCNVCSMTEEKLRLYISSW